MKALIAALLSAQAELPTLQKTREADTGKFTYSYATLADVIEAIKPVLNRNKIVFTQTMERAVPTRDEDSSSAIGERVLALRTTLYHESGETMDSLLVMPAGDGSAQAFGSAITYARRYALMSIVGIAPDDDDGMSARVYDPDDKSTIAENAGSVEYLENVALELFPDDWQAVLESLALRRFGIEGGDYTQIREALLPLAIRSLRTKARRP